MKTTIWLLICAFFIIYISKPTVHFKPFSIDFASPYTPFAIIFLSISLILFRLQLREDVKLETLDKYYRLGFKEGSDFTVEQINEKLKEQENNYTISIKRDVE